MCIGRARCGCCETPLSRRVRIHRSMPRLFTSRGLSPKVSSPAWKVTKSVNTLPLSKPARTGSSSCGATRLCHSFASWVIDAYLGRKEVALREGRRAVELLPVERTRSTVRCLSNFWRDYSVGRREGTRFEPPPRQSDTRATSIMVTWSSCPTSTRYAVCPASSRQSICWRQNFSQPAASAVNKVA